MRSVLWLSRRLGDWEDVDDDWDEDVEEAFKESKYTKDGGIIDADNPNIIHYPATN